MQHRISLLVLAFFSLSAPAHTSQGVDVDAMLFKGMKYDALYDQSQTLCQFAPVLQREGLPVPSRSKEHPKQSRCAWFINKITCGFFCKPSKVKFEDEDDDEVVPPSSVSMTIAPNPKPTSSVALASSREVELKRRLLVSRPEPSSLVIEEDTKEPDPTPEDRRVSLLTSFDLDRALVEDFLGKKKTSMQRGLRSPLFTFCVNGSVMYLGTRIITDSMASGFGALFLFQMAGENLTLFSKAFNSIYLDKLADALLKHEIKYARQKRFLPPELQSTIEDAFAVARKSDLALDATVKFTQIALSLPLKSKRCLMITQDDLNTLVGGYINDIREPIALGLLNHYVRYSENVGHARTPRTVMYFKGPPGVGKTFLMRELTKRVRSKLIELVVPAGGAEEFIGTAEKPGTFLTAICGAPRNSIISIDEMDRALDPKKGVSQTFLPFLEPSTTHVYLPFLRSMFDISHFGIFAAGNGDFEGEEGRAIRSRLRYVNVGALKPDFKLKILTEKVPEALRETLQEHIRAMVEASRDDGVRQLVLDVNDAVNVTEHGAQFGIKMPDIKAEQKS